MSNTQFKYPIEVFWSDEDDGYIAVIPDLPGCSAWGKTTNDALHEAEHAAYAWISAAHQAKRVIPQPSIAAQFSGKFLMRMPRQLHAQLARAANLEGVSLNQYLLYLLTQRHALNIHTERLL